MVVFGFIAAIPWTYFAHVIATPLNILLQKLTPRGALAKIDDLEEQETFGISRIEQFSWKRRLDFDACTECGRCQDVCCAQISGGVLSPKKLIGKLRRCMHGEDTRPLHGEVVTPEELWACTTCMACVQECPARIDIVDTIVDLRRHLAMEQGAFPPGCRARRCTHVQGLGNPWGIDPADRLKWADGLDVPILAAGAARRRTCTGSAARRPTIRATRRSRARWCASSNAAGVSWGVMRDERCHGEFGRRLGEEYLYQTAAEENIANMRQHAFQRVLTHCPHCMNTFRNEYRQFAGGELEVVHHAALIAQLIADGRIAVRCGAPT